MIMRDVLSAIFFLVFTIVFCWVRLTLLQEDVMKKNPGRKERRMLAYRERKANGRRKMKLQEWQDKKDRQLTSQL